MVFQLDRVRAFVVLRSTERPLAGGRVRRGRSDVGRPRPSSQTRRAKQKPFRRDAKEAQHRIGIRRRIKVIKNESGSLCRMTHRQKNSKKSLRRNY